MKKMISCARTPEKTPLHRRLSWMLTGLLLLCLQLHAQDAGSQKVSLQADNQPLENIFRQLEQQTGYTFAYNSRDIKDKLEQKFTFRETNKPLSGILTTITKRTGLQFRQSGKIMSVQNGPVPQPKAPGKVSGKIIDEDNGQPVFGATVRIGDTGATTDENGAFTVPLPAGTYTATVSNIGYGTKAIQGVTVTDNQTFMLDLVLKRAKGQLSGVVVTSQVKKEGVAALLARQKNTAEISNGISAEQISATPDKNVGEVLKRISGVSTNDNRRVVIRGIAERYNVAQLDGVTLPSTDVQVRDFEFDIIPSNLIDNIIVSKGYTPDMSFGFGGGLVQVNTLAIPNQNFNNVNFGYKYNDLSTGKEFLGYKRGKGDYFGYDDGARKKPYETDVFSFDLNRYNPKDPYTDVTPPGSGLTPITPEMIAEQNKKIGGTERLGTRIYKARPSQNYQLSLGRSYNLGKGRIGFVGSVSYRNEQTIDDILTFERGSWSKNGNNVYDAITLKEKLATTSKQYNFTTTWAALVNGGFQSKNHKITTRNFYSRGFQGRFIRHTGFGSDVVFNDPGIQENDSPKFIELLQNKLTGEHRLGRFVIDWNLARNGISNNEQDAIEASLTPEYTANGLVYTYSPNSMTDPGVGALNRAEYKYKEENLMGDVALSYNFNIGKQAQKIKAGYQYLERHGEYDWFILPLSTLNPKRFAGIPIQHWGQYFDFKDPLNDIAYYPGDFSLNKYKGKNTNEAFFGMLDNRVAKWLRVVYGLRIESYVYNEIKDGVSKRINAIDQQAESLRRYIDPKTGKLVHKTLDASTEELKWRYLPSANIIITPVDNLNFRASYAQTVVRPSLIENSGFSRFNPTLGRIQHNTGVISTVIDHYDAKLEWYPRAGEVLSIGYFYKYFKNPVELYLDVTNSSQTVDAITGNSDWAKVHGWEFDMRKNLGFLSKEFKPLQHFFLTANLTLQQSEVQASRFSYTSFGENPYDKQGLNYAYREKILLKEKRPLYGQVPVLYNIGLLFNNDRLSANVVFNHMGYKTFTVGILPEYVEYERPRDQVDAQVGYSFLKNQAMKVKLNMSNLLDNPHRFYTNARNTYKEKDGMAGAVNVPEWSQKYEWVFGFSEKYEKGYYQTSADGKTKTRIGDTDTFIRKVGRSFSLSASYSF